MRVAFGTDESTPVTEELKDDLVRLARSPCGGGPAALGAGRSGGRGGGGIWAG